MAVPPLLTVATWNVRGCPGWRVRRDPELLAAVLAETNADVIALQETAVHDDFDLAGEVARLLGMKTVFGANVVRRRGRLRYGNAILSRVAPDSATNHDLSVEIAEPRGCLLAAIGGVTFGSVHLGLLHGERHAQVRRLHAVLSSIDGPSVIAGDMNDWFRGRDTGAMRERLADAWSVSRDGRRFTYPALFPLFRLDHVYVSGEVSVGSCGAHVTPLSKSASDHLPVVARLRIRTAADAARRATA